MDDTEWQAAENAKRRARGEYSERPWLRRIGFIARILVYAVLFLLLYAYWHAYWPETKWDRPLATLTMNDILTPLFFIAACLVLIWALFNPDDDDFARDAWGWIEVVLIAGFVLLAGFVYDRHLFFNVLVFAVSFAFIGFFSGSSSSNCG